MAHHRADTAAARSKEIDPRSPRPAAAHEPWAAYDPAVIGTWAADYLSQDPGSADLSQWNPATLTAGSGSPTG
jgi:hypothetical protein